MPRTTSFLLVLGLFTVVTSAQYAKRPDHGLSDGFTDAVVRTVHAGERSLTPPGFEENKGQVVNTDGTPAIGVRFRMTQGNTSLFLLANGIAHQFNRLHRPEGLDLLEEEARRDPSKGQQVDELREEVYMETYRMDMVLEGADLDARSTTEGRSNDYTQYYNHNALDVHTYQRITYHEVYPGIDWVVYTNGDGLKYDFVVHPGADPAMIRLRFKDHEELLLEDDGSLVRGNRMGRLRELPPVSFQNGREVDTRFVLTGNELCFAIDAYDETQPLTIDPALMWGTYYGGENGEAGECTAVDGFNNVYMAGYTNSMNSIASAGHQIAFGGGARDALLVKFDQDGNRLWGTYYGGTDEDKGFSCAVDGSNNVYLAGWTGSTSSIATGGHQNDFGGDISDAFLVKFDPAGTRLWGTYYGGSDEDVAWSCATDGNNAVYLVGETRSDSSIAYAGFQDNLDGYADAFLVKFDTAGNRLWSTYYGGIAWERGNSCAISTNGDIILAGTTSSSGSIASGGHQNSLGGFYDAFLVKFDPSGSRLWSTYYGGSSNDLGLSCVVDDTGDICLAGETRSTSGIAYMGHQNTFGGGDSDSFLAKFDASGTCLWATYYGGSSDEWWGYCALDQFGNAYLAAETKSANAIASIGYQDTIGGNWDAFLVKFDAIGSRLWGTYYGGEYNDYNHSCTLDNNDHIYLAGLTYSTIGISSGGHQNDTSGVPDAYLAKFADLSTNISATPVALHQDVRTFAAFPNPVRDQIEVYVPEDLGQTKEINLFLVNVTGRLVWTRQAYLGKNTIPLGGQPAGTYLLYLSVDGTPIASEKLVVE